MGFIMNFLKSLKKRYKILISAVIILAFLAFVYLFMTPDGALRLAVFWHGYPKKAVVMDYIGTENEDYGSNVSTYSVIDPPIRQDGVYEENWAVTQYWLFYTAKCTDLYE